MTMLQQIAPQRGRRTTKFTPANIQKIKDWVAEGISREEIAKSLGATVGSLQSHAHAWGSVCEDVTMLRVSASRAAPLFPMVGSMPVICNESLILGRNFSWSCRARATSKRLILPSPLATLGGSELKRQHRV